MRLLNKIFIKKLITGTCFSILVFLSVSSVSAQVDWENNIPQYQPSAPTSTTTSASTTNNYNNCTPDYTTKANGKQGISIDCPNGNEKRNDISVQCVQNQNAKTCINTIPVDGNVDRISEDLCYRDKGYSNKRNHNAIDYAVTVGTPVTAAADGIAYGINCLSNGGRTIKIVHQKSEFGKSLSSSGANEYTSIYMHLSKINVDYGTPVKKGDVIGYSGRSTCQNGKLIENYYKAHLHFEMRDGNALNSNSNPVLNPLCNEIQSLCEQKSSNVFYQGQNQINYDAEQCRNCDENPQSCQKPEENAPEEKSEEETKYDQAMASDDCVDMYPEDNLLLLTATGESGRDAGKTNWYAKYNGCYGNGVTEGKDDGGCSYGFVQMACGSTAGGKVSDGSYGNFRNFMTRLEAELPDLFAKLSQGNDLDTTIKYACNDQAYPKENAAFRAAWESLGSNKDFYNLQYTVNYETYVGEAKKWANNAGVNWDTLSPELKMTFVSAAVAAPLLCKNMINDLVKKYDKDLNKFRDKVIVDAAIIRADRGYSNYLDTGGSATYEAAKKRAEKDAERTLLSAHLRDAIQQSEIPGSKYYGMTPDEIAIDLTGMRLCSSEEMGTTPKKQQNNKPTVVNSSAQDAANAIAASASNRDCSVSNYRNSFKSCIFCDVFKVLFNTASIMVKGAYDVLVNGIVSLVIIGTALWIAMTILSYISSFESKDPRNLVKLLANQIFVVIVVLVLLKTDSNYFLSIVLEPIFNTGMELGKLVMTGANGETCNPESLNGILTAENGGGLPESMGTNIICIIDAIQGKILDLMAVGSSSICVGFYIKKVAFIFPHLGYVITGVLLWISAWLFMLIYPWLLVDAVLQMCIASALLPVAIGAYAFKYTKQMFVGKVWNTFMNAMFTFVFLSIVIAILLKALDSITADAFNQSLVNAGSGLDFNVILSSLAWWSINLLKIIFILLLGWAVLGEAQKLAGKFASGIKVSSIGSSVGTLAASGVRAVANKTTSVGLKTVSKGAGAIKETVSEKYNDIKQATQTRNMRNRVKNATQKGTLNADGTLSYRNSFGRKFTVNKDGSSYSYKDIFGNVITKTTTKNAKGHSVLNITKTKKDGSSVMTSNDGWIKSTIKRNKNGEIINQQTEMMTAAGKHLINQDGSINQIAFNNIMQNSGFDDDTLNLALINQLVKERFENIPDLTKDFASRSLSTSIDQKGRKVFTLIQKNNDGSSTNMSMTFGDNNQRILTELETISAFNQNAVKYSSDGILNKVSHYQYENGQVNQNSIRNDFSFSKFYHNRYGRGLNSLGQFARGIPDSQILFSDEDINAFTSQIANYGDSSPLQNFR